MLAVAAARAQTMSALAACLVCLSCSAAYEIYDADTLLKKSPEVRMQVGELEQVIQLEPRVEYSTMGFEFEYNQYLALYGVPEPAGDPAERCYNDHLKCLTTVISSSRPVCAKNYYDNVESNFGSLCDLYLDNCKKEDAYWTVVDYGTCARAHGGMQFALLSTPPATTEAAGTTSEVMPWFTLSRGRRAARQP